MKSILSLALTLALLLCCTAPLASAETASDNILRVMVEEDPETLDVQLTTDSYTIPLNCFDRLVECETVDGEAQLVPGLAESWDVSEDGKVYTFHLREGITFHNGDPLTADDVVYTVNRMMTPATNAKNTDVFEPVVGAMEVLNGEAETVSGVVALDDLTVEITLKDAYAPFLANLATPGGSIFNRESTEPVGEQFGVDPSVCFGTGAFQVTGWELGSKVTMVANPNYYKGAPAVDGIDILIVPDGDTQRMLFETNQADVFDFDMSEGQLDWFMSNGYEDQIVAGSRAGTYYFMFNTAIEPLNNPAVRQALQMSVDRQAILDSIYSGQGHVLNSFLPNGVVGHTDDVEEIPYDPEGAKALLAEAGYENGFDMEISVMSDATTSLTITQILQGYWSQIGVNVTIKQFDESTYYAVRKDGELPSYYNSWSADFNDPDNFLYTFFSYKNTVGRSVNYDNDEIMTLLENARVMVDVDERLAAYQKIDDVLVHEDHVVLPLYQRNHLFCLNPRVQNFVVSWNGWSSMSYYSISLAD
ncbi:MAG: ABC transporter substrate-binding protein [Clostridia bacterium]|nr:ABC transporter substrate-binding protein [Clostridia bacterium]